MHSQQPADASGGATDSVPGLVAEDDVMATARSRTVELGRVAVGAHTGAMLEFLACSSRARAIVEIGTGAGVSGLHLLGGMPADGVLTSIDIEPECQRQARGSFVDAGFRATRTRLITGQALEVLPRFTAGGYDLVFVDGAPMEFPHYYEQALPLLRPGGVIAFHGLSWDETSEDGSGASRTLRRLAQQVRRDERLVPASLPTDAGLLIAALAQ